MSEPVFEAYVPSTVYASISATTSPARSFLSDKLPSLVAARMAPAQMTHPAGTLVEIHASMPAATGFLSDRAPNMITASFMPAGGYADTADLTPTINYIIGGMPPPNAAITTSLIVYGEIMAACAPIRALLSDKAPSMMVAFTRPDGAFIWQMPTYVGGVAILQSPGVLEISGGTRSTLLVDMLMFLDRSFPQQIDVLIERVGLHSRPASMLDAFNRITDAVDFLDQIGVIWHFLVDEGVSIGSDVVPTLRAISDVLETIELAAGLHGALHARSLVIEALAIHDALQVVFKESLTDPLAFAAVLKQKLKARSLAIDGMTLAAVPVGHALLAAIVDESVELGDTLAHTLRALSSVTDALGLSLTVTLGDSTYLAWVVNTETKAFSQYENYPFNSYCDQLDGSYLGAADDGIYLLDGDTDDGDAINARIRWGLSRLGTGRMKHMPSMYLGYSASGSLVLKVITTSPDGEKIENWYQLGPRNANATREGRIKIGKALRSVYWGFELANIDGSDFSLDTIELYPLILERRLGGSP